MYKLKVFNTIFMWPIRSEKNTENTGNELVDHVSDHLNLQVSLELSYRTLRQTRTKFLDTNYKTKLQNLC